MIKMTNDNRMLRSCVFSVLAGVLAIYAISRTRACYRLTAKLYRGGGEEAYSTRVDDRYKSDVEQSDAVAVCRQSLVIHPVLEQPEKVKIERLSEQTKKPESLLWTQTDHNKPLTLIVVPERNKWLLAAAAPTDSGKDAPPEHNSGSPRTCLGERSGTNQTHRAIHAFGAFLHALDDRARPAFSYTQPEDGEKYRPGKF